MSESIHDTQDEAVAAAIAASPESGVVIIHNDKCKIVGGDEDTCTCVPLTLRLGASA